MAALPLRSSPSRGAYTRAEGMVFMNDHTDDDNDTSDEYDDNDGNDKRRCPWQAICLGVKLLTTSLQQSSKV